MDFAQVKVMKNICGYSVGDELIWKVATLLRKTDGKRDTLKSLVMTSLGR
jgi:hypothetical protein